MFENINNRRGRDIAKQIEEKCFTEEQKRILTITQGKINITIADQINRIYGNKFLTWGIEETIINFAYKVNEFDYLIDEIGRKLEIIKEIKNPNNLMRLNNSTNTMINMGANMSCSDSGAYTSNTSKSNAASESTNNSSLFNSEPTKLIEDIEIFDTPLSFKTLEAELIEEDKANAQIYTSILEKYKFYVDNTPTHTEYTEQEKNLLPAVENKIRAFHNLNISKNRSGDRSKSNTISTNISANKSESEASNLNCATTINDSTEWTKSTAYLTALKTEIPQLRDQFWNKFKELFNGIDTKYYKHNY